MSINISADTSGFERLANLFAKAAAAVDHAVEGDVAKAVDEVWTQARNEVPFLTGDLQASIDKKLNGNSGVVWTDLRYAQYVEYGTYKDQPQPFMTPAGDAQKKRFPIRVARTVSATVKGVLG
jgi:HK97 gp10 family phage protein